LRNFHRIYSGLNVIPLVHAVMRQPELWDQNTVRTTHQGSAHAQASDILLRYNVIPENPEDLALVIQDLENIDYPAMKVLPQVRPILYDIMRLVEGERLGRVVITRLPPGGRITPHVDGGAPATYYDRYQVALQSGPGAVFRAGAEQVQMATGDVWWFDNTKEHEVINNSADDRLALILDIKTGGSSVC